MTMARFDESYKEIMRARELDPLSLIINRNVGQHFYRARQYDQAIEALQKTIEMDPNFTWAHFYLGKVYLQKSMFERALEELQKEKDIMKRFDPNVESLIGVAYALLGKRDKALQILENLKARSKEMYMASSNIALIYYALGDSESGFEWMEKAYEERDNWLRRFNSDPIYDMTHVDPRLKEFPKKMGLVK
jgi:tetratricopeptide (TPR) repeat protein